MSNSPPGHRISRLYYGPRAIGFLLAFAASLFLFFEGHVQWVYLPAAIVLFLVYPHLVYRWSCASRQPKRAELKALLVDAFLLGGWAALTAFNLGITFALLCAVSLNNAINRGLAGVWLAGACFLAGALPVAVLTGFQFAPLASLTATAVSLLAVLLYMLNVGVIFHSQHALLLRVKNDAQRKKKVFETLASAGVARKSSDKEEELVSRSLGHLHRLLPRKSGIGVVLRDIARPGTVHYAGFRHVDDVARAQLLTGLGVETPPGHLGCSTSKGAQVEYQVLPMGTVSGSCKGFFVIQTPALSEADRGMIGLFLQQLAAALQNLALTRRLVALANTDPLTGLHNRASLTERLAYVMEQKLRCPETDFTVILADVNGLKEANDVHGHEIGDELILCAARVMRDACREVDLVSRIGGDEFVIVCPSTDASQCAALVARLEQGFASAGVPVPGPDGRLQRLPLKVSLGVADSREYAAEDVFREADRRMYENKKAFYEARTRPT